MHAKFTRLGMPGILALALALLVGGIAGAQAQQKRLGFVVGIAELGETDHPTALQDAGLVSQSLKGAGFDVTEGANLNQSEFRAAFREFTQKANAAGPDAVIALYIAGLSLQDDGENVLIPSGANLRQRADLGLEGLRLSDFVRALAATPARGRLIMLDTGYNHPYAQLVAEGARGLAITDPVAGTIIAYNNAPGIASPLPQSGYGPYAMALAEALREPGLNPNQIFERVRLRVHEMSSGAQTPWNVGSLPADLILNVPAAGAPAPVVPPPVERPLAQAGAPEAYARVVAQDSIAGYQDFLNAYPDDGQAKRVRALLAARREALFWARTRRANTDRAYWTYLKRYPRGSHAAEAEARLSRLSAPIEPPPSFEEVLYDDVPPPPPEEVVVFDSVVAEDAWGFLPPPPPPEVYPAYLLPPPPVDIVELAPPPPNPLLRALPVIGLGVGAAILANRAWRRPTAVRPVVAPPIPRPMRPAGGWANRQPVVLPPRPAGMQPGVRPGGIPGAAPQPRGLPQPQGAIGAPGMRPGGLPQPQGGIVAPGGRPGGLPQPQGGVVAPGGRPGGLPQPQGGVVAPGGRPGGLPAGGPAGVGRPGGLPAVGPAGAGRPGVGGPQGVVPPRGAPVVQPRPVPQVRQAPVVRQPIQRPTPQVRQAPVYRAPVQRPAPVYRAPVQRPAPVYRAPVQRSAPVYRPPVQRAAPVYRPPVAAPRPAPVYRPPAPAYRAPAAPSCTPQLRAMRRC